MAAIPICYQRMGGEQDTDGARIEAPSSNRVAAIPVGRKRDERRKQPEEKVTRPARTIAAGKSNMGRLAATLRRPGSRIHINGVVWRATGRLAT